jgi:hypothetical protein
LDQDVQQRNIDEKQLADVEPIVSRNPIGQ